MTLWYRQFLLIPRTTNVFDLEFTICMMFQKSLSNTKLITTFKQKTYIIYTHIHLILNIELLPFKYIYGKEVTPTIPHVLLSQKGTRALQVKNTITSLAIYNFLARINISIISKSILGRSFRDVDRSIGCFDINIILLILTT